MAQSLSNTLFSILKKASLSEKSLRRFTSPRANEMFLRALTSKTFNSQSNYESPEARGDGCVNLAATTYILNRFPKVKSLKWKAKLQQNVLGTRVLSMVCDILELTPHIRHKGILTNLIKEDVVEAFIGTIGEICEDNISAYYTITYSILSWCFDRVPFINLNHSEQFDPLSRLKELYDANKLVFVKGKVIPKPNGEYEKTFILPNKRVIMEKGQTEIAAEHNASLVALKEMEELGYKEKIPNPFEIYLRPEKEAVTLESLPKVPEDFEREVMKYFDNCVQKVKDVLMLNIKGLFKCFFDSKYYIGVNAADEKFVGVSVVDLIAVEYIFSFEKDLYPKKVTAMKHSLANGKLYVDALGNLKKFVQIPNEVNEDDVVLTTKTAFKSVVGFVFEVLNKEFGEGAGLAVWRNILFPYIKLNPPSESFAHPKTILNRRYPGRWKIETKEVKKGEEKMGWVASVYVEGKMVSKVEGFEKKDKIINKAAEEAVEKLGLN